MPPREAQILMDAVIVDQYELMDQHVRIGLVEGNRHGSEATNSGNKPRRAGDRALPLCSDSVARWRTGSPPKPASLHPAPQNATAPAKAAPAQAQSQTPAQNQAAKIPPDQLDSLVAPIALYPDPLLAQVLAASTYPLEIVQLQQWLAKNPALKDKALADAVAKQPWDPSVQSMAALPDLVKRLANDIQWTTDLGNAFLAQQKDVMDAIQRMRTKAQAKGTLKSTEQQKRRDEDGRERPAGDRDRAGESAGRLCTFVRPRRGLRCADLSLSTDLLPLLPAGSCVRFIQCWIDDGRVDERWMGLRVRLGRRQRLHQPQQ